MLVKTGTTNIDGMGSAENLIELLHGKVIDTYPGITFDVITNTLSAVASGWNAVNEKEVQIESTNLNIYTENFVDVDINSTGSLGVEVDIINSKRGSIDTGDGNDIINVTVQTNGAGWSNFFEVNSGAGNDYINFYNGSNSQYTSVNINSGEGHDVINISGLSASAANVSRHIDAGAGNDIVYGSDGNESIHGGSGNDLIYSAGGNDYIWGGAGADTIFAGAGNDFIVGGADADSIEAGLGNDQVRFDALDLIVDGGEGLDSLVVSGNVDVTDTVDFEAIVANKNTDSVDTVMANLQDGLIIMLGEDVGDSVSFSEATNFSAYGDSFTVWDASNGNDVAANFLDLANAQGFSSVDITNLNGYEDSNSGFVVWSDVDLLA